EVRERDLGGQRTDQMDNRERVERLVPSVLLGLGVGEGRAGVRPQVDGEGSDTRHRQYRRQQALASPPPASAKLQPGRYRAHQHKHVDLGLMGGSIYSE